MAKLKNTIDRKMFYGASPVIFERAKELRLNPTEAEKKLWNVLKNKQMLGLRFKFQHPVNHFIADFYCHMIKLVIEIDGSVHETTMQKERDEGRTFKMENFGISVLRFSNNNVFKDLNIVKNEIEKRCRELLDLPTGPLYPATP